MRAGIVVFFNVEQTKFGSGGKPLYLRTLFGRRSGLAELLGRLKRLGLPIFAPINGARPDPRLAPLLRAYGVKSFPVRCGAGHLDACRETVARFGLQHAVLCPPEAVFMSPELVRAQWRLHKKSGAGYSRLMDIPFGLAPEIISRATLEDLAGVWLDFGPLLGGCLSSNPRLHEKHRVLNPDAASLGVGEFHPTGKVLLDGERAWKRASAFVRRRGGRTAGFSAARDLIRSWRAADAAAVAKAAAPAPLPRPKLRARKMRIAYLLMRSDFYGGVQGSAGLIVKHLDRRRFEPSVLGPENGPFAASMRRQRVPFARYGPLPNWRFWSLDLGGMADIERLEQRRRVTEFLRASGADAVHCHGFDRILVEGALSMRVPVVLHLHGYPFLPQAYPPNTHAARLDLGYEWRLLSRIIAVSRDVARSLDSLGVPSRMVTTIHNGIDGERFDPARSDGSAFRRIFGLGPRTPLVVSVGRLDANRRLEVLLTAFKKVLRLFPEARLALVGEPSFESYAQNIDRAIAVLRLEGKVLLPGPREDVADVLAAADVFVNPRPLDPFPLSVIEAMAMARPIVAIADGGCREMIEHRRSGLLVGAEDPAAMAGAMLEALGSPAFAAKLGEAARRRALARFDAGAQTRKVEDVYRSLAA
ncbi:MAG: glycosyltransferase family 4 protein [Elusimicrobiota bacterium]